MDYLTKEQLKAQCPVAFATQPTNDAVTDKYVHISTEKVIDDLEKLGWKPVQATQRKSRGKQTIFSKHMIQFQNPDIIVKGEDGDDEDKEKELQKKLKDLKSLQSLGMTFGHTDE